MRKKICIISTEWNDDFTIINKELENYDYDILRNDYNKNNYQTTELIDQSDIVIAILMKADQNIVFMLGYALGKSKEIIIIANNSNLLVNDLKGVNYIQSDYVNETTIMNIISFLNKIDNTRISFKNKIIENYKYYINSTNDSLEIFDKLSGFEFENVIIKMFKDMKFIVEENSNRALEDYGFDLSLRNYLNYQKTIVEIKKYSLGNKVSIGNIQQFFGALISTKADHGIFISFSGYTESARGFAKNIEKDIELLDLDEFIEKFKNKINIG